MAADVLPRLFALTGDAECERLARGILAVISAAVAQHLLAFGHLLSVFNFYLSPPEEIAIVGNPSGDDTRELLEVVYSAYRPNKVVAVGLPDDQGSSVPLLAGRGPLDERATAYVCGRFTCQRPVNTARDLAAQLRRSHQE